MIRYPARLLLVGVAAFAVAGTARAQSRVPSTHDLDCVGLICNPIDPAHPPPPPPCQGLICTLTPSSMAQPYSAAEAQAAAKARAEAAAAAPPTVPVATMRKHRKTKMRSARVVAPRTPDPGAAPEAAR